ncbi:FAD-dependent monooxygenase [Maritimibacter sp. DP1N21-5]|uniref:FAD-dependent monooxygenase n=1 Tax=Maritimibacter sp. DP1N21-5 TaxID=2836867 RepID=UPI001C43FE8D|nr:FAD-dependent monooxygenase [Maritimibacter sp. DP1N21-5]MBV7407519.1 FAD-dependent monooxygenase [Maritimibacter sp. DP1N21-5]
MQYYVDGFRGGDPDVHPTAAGHRKPGDPLPEKVDVLIAGCGPAGLCMAAQMAQFPEFTTMIVEPKPGPMEKGQADGVNVRSMEMFQAFGFGEKVKRESYWVNQTNFWMPDPANPDAIRRVGRVQDVADDLSEMPHTLINQARIHELFLDVARKSPTRLEPDYGLKVADLTIDTTTDDHPVIVSLEYTEGPKAGQTTTVRANYVIGADGARSNVRTAIGGKLVGDAAHQAWGVMDILANTDFPDVRYKNLITSRKEGNILILPREGGYLFRMYVELDKLNPDERVSARNLNETHMIAAANRIMAPYTLDVKEVVWWSVYEIGHRITDRFDDVPDGETATRTPRVFTAGDACHTHSPKAGQGMNVSMGDTFNLGWKLGLVLRGRAPKALLHSYTTERREEARRLVETDHKWARIMSAPLGESELDGTDEPRFIQHFKLNGEFTAGLAVRYDESALTAAPTHQALATGEPIGKRFHSAPVVRAADAMAQQLGHVHDADGRFRVYIFAGADETSAYDLVTWLATDPASPILKHRQPGDDIDATIDVRTIVQERFDTIDLTAAPSATKPTKGKLGLQDHEKLFCIDPREGRNIYDLRGIDKEKGAVIIVRPDQYVGQILPIGDTAGLSAYFAGILL